MEILDGFMMLVLVLLTVLSGLAVIMGLALAGKTEDEGEAAFVVFGGMILFAIFLTLSICYGVIYGGGWWNRYNS